VDELLLPRVAFLSAIVLRCLFSSSRDNSLLLLMYTYYYTSLTHISHILHSSLTSMTCSLYNPHDRV
jgi:hypothetical protein